MSGIYTKRGVNAQRKLFSNTTSYNDEIADLSVASEPRFFYRAVVVDVLFDTSAVPAQLDESMEYSVVSPELIKTAPRNSIIARIITDAADRQNSSAHVFYPAMSHTHYPLKPGEQVWVFFEHPASHDYGFWLSRIVEPVDVDDPNFTHGDRKFVQKSELNAMEKLDRAEPDGEKEDTPFFPNGAGTLESLSLAEVDAYKKIDDEAIANKIIVKEPVPRYNKRPADWAAEGSNNSLLVLGEDRTGAAAKIEGTEVSSKPEKDKSGAAGMFDIVVGRGIGKDRKLPGDGDEPKLTAPPVIKNSRGKLETNKNIAKTNKSEGDPDFEYDATRIYGAMDTNVDGNFGKPLPKLPGGSSPQKIELGSALIAKSNHIRIIAREDGTLRIVKEGTLDDEGGKGHAGIIIEKDGTIVIDGPHIVIGSGIEKGNGAGTQVYIGLDATEPIVLGNTMKKVLTDYTTQIKTAIDTFCKALAVVGTTIANPPGSLGNFGIPLPGLIALGKVFDGQGPNAANALMLTVDQATSKFQSDLTKTLSKNGKTK
jgi:hypothetical protein